MTVIQRCLAAISAAALLLTGSSAGMPVPVRTAQNGTVSSFAEKLRNRNRELCTEPFAELCYDSGSGQLLRDGSDAGADCGGFTVAAGALSVQREITLTQAERENGADVSGTVSFEEAAEKIGCVSRTENGRTVVESPFQSGTLVVRAAGAFDSHGGTDTASGLNGLHVLQYPTAADAYAAYKALQADDAVSLAEPDLICHICASGDSVQLIDDLAAGEWGYEAVGCDAFAAQYGQGTHPVCVAVLDTGIYAEHQWFQGRLAEGGCSFVPETAGIADDHAHGTCCAGILARCTGDNVKILPLKVLDGSGYGSSLQIYCAMLYAAEQGADLVSMSLSGDGQSLLLQESAALLAERGIPCIAAAGNDARDVQYNFPANLESVTAVSAVTDRFWGRSDPPVSPQERYELSRFSNSGMYIDFAAPGDSVTSAGLSAPSARVTDSGTSMAAPYVAACYANLMGYDPSLTADRIDTLLRLNAVDLGAAGYDASFGWGMVRLTDFVFADSSVEMPSASVPAGSYSELLSVALSCGTPDAEIYYTTDGSIPERANGICYDGIPLRISKTTELKAAAFSGDACSAVLHHTYRITCPEPTVSVSPGIYREAVQLLLSCIDGADIYYTLDGTVPDPATAIPYDGETVTVSETTVLGAVAVIGDTVSSVCWAAYDIGNQHPERLFRVEDTVLTGCYLPAPVIDLKGLAGRCRITITEVAPRVFAEHTELRAVTLPDTVRIIGESAFEGCTNLKSVTACGAVSLGSCAFAECKSLEHVQLGAVTEIPPYAFFRCVSLRHPGVNPAKLHAVGAYAFARSGCTGRFDLRELERLGVYAFSDLDDIELILPERITGLPEGLCRNTMRLSLTAMGVTEIGCEALASESGGCQIQKLELAFDKITAIGEKAFLHADLNASTGGQLIFSALTELEPSAFRHVTCRGMSFPKLKTVPQHAFSGIRAEVLRLDGAETVGQDAVSCKEASECCVVLGRHVRDMDPEALGVPDMFGTVAAPAGSAAASYCMTRCYPFTQTPSLYVRRADASVQQNSEARLTAIPLGTGLQVTWQKGSTAPKMPFSAEEQLFADLTADTAQPGKTVWQAMLWQDGRLIASEQREITVLPEPETAVIPGTDQPLLLFADEYIQQKQNAERQMICSFTASHAGEYWCFADAGPVTVMQGSQMLLRQIGDAAHPEQLESVHLKDGEEITVLVSGRKSRTVTVSEQIPEYSLSACALMQPSFDSAEYAPDAELPAVTVAAKADGSVLTEGTDYVLHTAAAPLRGRITLYALGIGRYAGVLSCDVLYTDPIFEDTPVMLNGAADGQRVFRFVPQESGEYLVSPVPGASGLQPDSAEQLLACISVLQNGLQTAAPMQENLLGKCFSARAGEPVNLEIRLPDGTECPFGLEICSLDTRRSVAHVTADESAFAWGDAPVMRLTDAETGTQLTAEKDYRCVRLDPYLPGTVRWLVTGTGAYCGCKIISTALEGDAYCASDISLNTPFLCGGTGIYRIAAESGFADPVLTSEDGAVFSARLYPVLSADGAPVWADGTPVLPEEPFSIGEGAVLAVQSADGKPHPFLLRAAALPRHISCTEIEPQEVCFTGKPMKPVFSITDDGRELTENVDYVVEYPAGMTLCGDYHAAVCGIGTYTGRAAGMFRIVQPDPAALPVLPGTENEAVFSEPAGAAGYRWTADTRTCCIRKLSLTDAVIRLTDSSGVSVGEVNGIGVQSGVYPVHPGETYLIYAALTDLSAVGAVRFSVSGETRDLTACTLRGETLLTLTAETELPELTLTDGDTVLSEGTDYTLLKSEKSVRTGRNILFVRGIGQYAGEIEYVYYCAPPLSELPEPGNDMILTVGTNAVVSYAEPGHIDMLHFTAEEDGRYYLNLSGFEKSYCTLLRYDADGTPSACRLCYDLKAGETLRLASVTDWAAPDCEPEKNAVICMTQTMPSVSFSLDGCGYQTHADGSFTVTSLPENQCGFVLPESVTDPITGITGRFSEISPALTWNLFTGKVTFYGTPGGAAEAFCDENGYCFSALEPDYSVRGDLTGDGRTNRDDVLTLNRWLTEGGGMMLPGNAAEAADLDGDGAVTLLDLAEIMRIAEP